jgi:hypothetical protein
MIIRQRCIAGELAKLALDVEEGSADLLINYYEKIKELNESRGQYQKK